MRWVLVLLVAACSFDRSGLTGDDETTDAPANPLPDAPTTPSAPDADPPDASPPDAFVCPEPYTLLATGCYYHGGTDPGVGDDLEYLAARERCITLGGHLAVIDDAAENAALTPFAAGAYPLIGLDDMITEDVWFWVNGAPLVWSNWNDGEPNDGGFWGDEECVELRPDGTWNDIACGTWKQYLCEWAP